MYSEALAFDIYGTLVNPLEMEEHLTPLAGESAPEIAALWRQKQLEFSFRHGLMEAYEDFGTVTAEALDFAAASHDLTLTESERTRLLDAYQNLRAYPDVTPALASLKNPDRNLVAFSNGREETTRKLLANAGILDLLDDVVSVHETRTFKPAPKVYEHLLRSLDLPANRVRLVSSNPFDVIGAASCGLGTAWLDRSGTPFDPWGVEPDIIASDVLDLNHKLDAKP